MPRPTVVCVGNSSGKRANENSRTVTATHCGMGRHGVFRD